ncbi:MAG: beta-ketoacyl-ACP synthase III [Bacteroidota bacterium]|nr:beta-ketoacyl-ACP synthase III [Bacteroidota bacterium]
MGNIHAAITGVAGYVPKDILSNADIENMVDTTDEWITTRTGIKERRILKETGKGTSDMAVPAVEELLRKTGTHPDEVEILICATVTPDMQFPATANIICDKIGIKNAYSFDMSAACSGFIFLLTVASKFIETGSAKKIICVGADKMTSITNYQDRTTCPLFGDGAGAVMLEPSEEYGIQDHMLKVDGAGRNFLYQKSGGSISPASHETIDRREHFVFQEGQAVFKVAVTKMADIAVEMMEKHNISSDELTWLVPHQANLRIIEAVARRMRIKREQVMINIHKYGNTTDATIPLCLWEYEDKLKKGDKIILTAFGGGFTWGSVYLTWAYDSK